MRELLDFTRTLAERSGEVIRQYFGRPDLSVKKKDDQSPVTEADRRAEEVMRGLIRERYPSHGIIGEEFGAEQEDAEFVWVLDPIDGTVSFASGCPLFGTLIGLLHGGKPRLGAIHQPVLRQLCVGNGEETTLNGRPVVIRDTDALADAVLLTTDIANVRQFQDAHGFERLAAATRLFRTWGDCYGYLLLVSGGADVMIDPVMHPWDLLPLIPVIEGAGGTITGWSGEDAATARSCVAASRRLHAQVLAVLNS
jgi:myo-inositol-1(or 4)-monophosphatase